MKRVLWVLALFFSTMMAGTLSAQDSWVQIEAQPSLAEAEERVRAYASAFPDVQGYRLASGWYAIVLGPYPRTEAERQLDLLRTERLIPSDSFIALAGQLGSRFWPAGADASAPAPAAETTPEPATAEPAEETIDQALASEAGLPPDARLDLQRAMQWFGVYAGKIDGSFGKGTRAAMAEWQARNGHEATGILTTFQREQLTAAWQAERAALGIETVTETEAGIVIDLPLGLVEFDGYEPPFVRFRPRDGSGYQIFLISRQGDARTLVALYERLQSLEVMPMGGERTLDKTTFTLNGADATRRTHAQAELSGGFVKGFMLVAPSDESEQSSKALDSMRASFTAVPDKALNDSLGEPSLVSAEDLTAGLEVRRPALSRSGVFVDQAGSVLTTAEVVDGCARLTLDRTIEATVGFRDDRLGIAILTPTQLLAPRAFAQWQQAPLRAGAEVAIAGFPYEDKLAVPVMSFGTLAEASGLNGEPDLARLAIRTRAGDIGAGVIDSSGALAGLLLPPRDGDGRDLPEGTAMAVQANALAEILLKAGIAPTPAAAGGTLAAEDLSKRARDMTVLVSCWK